MKKLIYLTLLIAFGCTQSEPMSDPSLIGILPQPSSVEFLDGTYNLHEQVEILVADHHSIMVSSFLQEYFTAKGIQSTVTESAESRPNIQLILSDKADTGSEGYHLTISKSGVKIGAKTDAGLFYGVQTLLQIMEEQGKSLSYMEIDDQPRFGYRGMHLDVCRHMFPIAFVKKYIDMMSHFKYNTFHWHLTEDQGWRIEIKKYPNLQEVAANRKETVIGRASTRTRAESTYDGQPYGGFYTQEEIKEVVAYASSRYITIVPEIEMPGHAQAALAAYPYLGCTGGPYETATTWGVFDDIYCAGKESTFEFLQNVLTEVLPLFPGQYVHIGGDESPKTKWEKCSHCQKRMKEEGLANEHELQSYFVQRMEKFINAQGKTMIGWDEILEGGLAPNAVVMSWRGEEGGIAAAQQNHQVIMTPEKSVYFDYYQADPATEPLAIGGMNTVEMVYGYEPIPAQLSAEQAKYVLGAQCNVWSEYLPTSDQVEYMVYPRALALSEVLWSTKENKDYNSFLKRVNSNRPLMDLWGINYAKHIFEGK